MAVKILHTSDWQLNRLLYNKNLHAENEAFLAWFITFINFVMLKTINPEDEKFYLQISRSIGGNCLIVHFFRDLDLRNVEVDELLDDKTQKLLPDTAAP